MAIDEMDEDKTLITGEVLSKGDRFKKTVIFGKYAVYKLTVQGEDFFLLDEQDVIGECDYKEK